MLTDGISTFRRPTPTRCHAIFDDVRLAASAGDPQAEALKGSILDEQIGLLRDRGAIDELFRYISLHETLSVATK